LVADDPCFSLRRKRWFKTRPLLHQSLAITRRNLELSALVQSERQQLTLAQKLRWHLDYALSLVSQAQLPAEETYQEVLVWKGAVFARQRWLRARRMASDPKAGKFIADLETTSRRLAALTFNLPEPTQQQAWRAQLEELTEQRERLEKELTAVSAAFVRQKKLTNLTPQQLGKLLPAETGLVDFLEYTHSAPPKGGKGSWSGERRLAAFVVRRDAPLVRLNLGPVKAIAEAVERWRQTIKQRHSPVLGKDDVARELRRLLWEPLEPHLKGVRIVLLAPDGALNRLPFGALPGKDEKKYLLEEIGVAIVPAPQLLPELLADSPIFFQEERLRVGRHCRAVFLLLRMEQPARGRSPASAHLRASGSGRALRRPPCSFAGLAAPRPAPGKPGRTWIGPPGRRRIRRGQPRCPPPE
jgi:hypothetical protein